MPKLKRPSALFLIALCFLTSGAMRVWESGAAIAEEIGDMAKSAMPAETQAPAAMCPPQLEPESLLLAIRERQADLDAREARIDDREQVLRVARLKIEEQLAALETAEEQLKGTLALADQAAEKDIARLTSVYENMKPKNAAEIFETMDVTFAAGFLMRMRPDAAAGIMASLSSEAAYAISVVMAGRNANVPTE